MSNFWRVILQHNLLIPYIAIIVTITFITLAVAESR